MNIQYSHLIPVALATLLTGACSDSQTDVPVPVADPATYIAFAPPTLNLNATVGDFSSNDSRQSSRAEAGGVGEFHVWGFCQGRNAANTGEQSSTAVMDWNTKAGYFLNRDRVADLVNLNGATVRTDGSYAVNYTEWNSNDNALHSFIGAAGNATFTMQPSGSTTFGDNKSKGPSLRIQLPMEGGNLDTPRELNDQPDVMIAATFDRKSGSGYVPMSFMHIMTGIRFRLHNHSNKNLTLTSVTYSGKFFNRAFYDFSTDSPVMSVDESSTYSGTFNMIEGVQTIAANSSAYMNNDMERILMLLPNPAGTTDDTDEEYVLGSDKKITVTYRLDGDTEDRTWVHNNFTLSYLPQPNTRHTANLHFVGDEFVIVFQDDSSKNWQNGSDASLTIK